MFWCVHCGQQGLDPADIKHEPNCAKQTRIRYGHRKPIRMKWCAGCGDFADYYWYYRQSGCRWCDYPLQQVFF